MTSQERIGTQQRATAGGVRGLARRVRRTVGTTGFRLLSPASRRELVLKEAVEAADDPALLDPLVASLPSHTRERIAHEVVQFLEQDSPLTREVFRQLPGRERILLTIEQLAAMETRDGAHPLRGPIADAFHRLYYDEARFHGGSWHLTTFLGTRVWKLPLDLWQYQELLYELRPDLIVECGTAFGGSARYLATVCDALDHGRILTIDIEAQDDLPQHPRIRYVSGSSVSPEVVDLVRQEAEGAGIVLVILDSDHSRDHVLAECRAYADLVTPGSYLIVEDTNVHGHPVYPEHGPGPAEGLAAFLAERDDFEHDTARDKFLVTFNPGGWLRRKGST